MSIVVLSGSNLEIRLGLVNILVGSPLKSSPNVTMLRHSRDGKYTYSNQLTNLKTIIW